MKMKYNRMKPEKIDLTEFDEESGESNDCETFDRADIWFFYAYFAEIAKSLLSDFMDVAEIKPGSCGNLMSYFHNPPHQSVGRKDFDKIDKAFGMLIDYYKNGGLKYRGRKINFEHGDTIKGLTDALHLFVNILPYLNDRHYSLSKERHDGLKYKASSFRELCNLDRTLAKAIYPTLSIFANLSVFYPRYFQRMYVYPIREWYNHDEWDRALDTMVSAWKWLTERRPSVDEVGWEEVPRDVYYGLHLFAEYLPEMQND